MKNNVYAITIREVLERTVCVEAEDLDQAIDKVEYAYNKANIILDADDFDGNAEIEPSCYAGQNGIVYDDELDYYKDQYQWIK